jgi:hypothetical protein
MFLTLALLTHTFLIRWCRIFPSRIYLQFMRVKVPTAANMMLALSWVSTPCGFVNVWQRFGETCCLHLQGCDNAGKWRACIGFKEGRLRERDQSETTNMGKEKICIYRLRQVTLLARNFGEGSWEKREVTRFVVSQACNEFVSEISSGLRSRWVSVRLTSFQSAW